MMTEDRFWDIIESSREKAKDLLGSKDEEFATLQEETLRETLLVLPPGDVAEFDQRMSDFHARAYRWDLWGAAYWLGGGCSDDGFMDFRFCLVSLGKDLYTRILSNPDVISETVNREDMPYMQAEGIGYVPGQVYTELTGEEMPEPNPPFKHPSEPAGEHFEFDNADEMRKRYPRLVSLLPNGG